MRRFQPPSWSSCSISAQSRAQRHRPRQSGWNLGCERQGTWGRARLRRRPGHPNTRAVPFENTYGAGDQPLRRGHGEGTVPELFRGTCDAVDVETAAAFPTARPCLKPRLYFLPRSQRACAGTRRSGVTHRSSWILAQHAVRPTDDLVLGAGPEQILSSLSSSLALGSGNRRLPFPFWLLLLCLSQTA